MRFHINSGKYKGLRLYMESNAMVRPSKSLVKKSFFDSMRDLIHDSIFVECFAGSGQMGFDAISLGAKRVVFFELDSKVYKNLIENIKILQAVYGIEDMIQHYNINFFHSLQILESLAQKDIDSTILLYLDPPFMIRDGFCDIYEKIIRFIESFSKDLLDSIDIIVFEKMSGIKIADKISTHAGIFYNYKARKLGKTSLAYYKGYKI